MYLFNILCFIPFGVQLIGPPSDQQRHSMSPDIATIKLGGLHCRASPLRRDALDAMRSPCHGITSWSSTTPQVAIPSRSTVIEASSCGPAPNGTLGVPDFGGVDGLGATGVVVCIGGSWAIEGKCHYDIIGFGWHLGHGDKVGVGVESRMNMA